jgi:hypothetical protein
MMDMRGSWTGRRARRPAARLAPLAEQFAQRTGAMAEPVLFLRIEAGGGERQVGQVEMRIVAKAVGAFGLVDDLAVPQALADERTGIVLRTHQGQYRHVPGAAVRHALQLANQQRIVGLVGLFAAVHLGVARGVHARRAVQRGHAQPRIVRQGRQAGQAAGMAGLGQRIFDKGDVGLFGLGHAQLALRDQFDAQRREQGGKFAQLAGVVGRQHDAAQGFGNLGSSHGANCIGRGLRAPPARAIPLRGGWARSKSLLTGVCRRRKMARQSSAQQRRHILLSIWPTCH